MIGEQELLEDVDLQHAETATEIDLLLRCDVLITENHHVVIQMGFMNAGKIPVIQRPGQVQTDDLRTHFFGEWTHVE